MRYSSVEEAQISQAVARRTAIRPLIVARNDGTGGRVVVLDARTGGVVHAIATHGSVAAAGGELVLPSILALNEPADRAYVTKAVWHPGARCLARLTSASLRGTSG
jgi:hypothetical protein